MKIKILTFLFVCFILSGCNNDESGVEIDKEGMRLVDTYLGEPDLQAFHPKLKVSRANIIESYEKEYTRKNRKDVTVTLAYDKQTYDKDFENEVKVYITSNAPHRVILQSKFFNGVVNLKKEGLVTVYSVSGVEEKDLRISIKKILPPDTGYITKNYKNL